MNFQVNWEIQALDQTAGFLGDDPTGVAALWDTVSQLADEPRPPESFPYGSPDLRPASGHPVRNEPAKTRRAALDATAPATSYYPTPTAPAGLALASWPR